MAKNKVSRRIAALTCGLCGASVYVEGVAGGFVQECTTLGCSGTMRRYRMNAEAFRCARTDRLSRCRKNLRKKTERDYDAEKISYDDYLKSPLWRSIRNRVIDRDRHTCVLCGMPGKQVHHLSYAKSVMDGKDISRLVLLCESCHEGIEFDDDGNKLTCKQAAKKYKRRLWASKKSTSTKTNAKRRKILASGI